MENEFRIPTIEPKFKVPVNKTNETNEVEPVTKLTNSSESTSDDTNIISTDTESTANSQKSNLINVTSCPYKEPKWSMPPSNPDLNFHFEILKQGQIVTTVEKLQSKAFWTIGKLPTNDIIMEHPTVSRYHAVLQYLPESKETPRNDNDDDDDDDDKNDKNDENDETDSNQKHFQKNRMEPGWYLYDLSSTHGTFVNKQRIPSKTYIRIRVGYFLKFAGSTKSFILQGPDYDAEPEAELTITEMKEQRIQKQQEIEQKRIEEKKKREEEEKRKENEGISWGMADDADEVTDLAHNPYATSHNEELFLDDPKKTLRGFFEREGLDLEYKVDEVSSGTYLCRIELPITDSIGRNIMAEFTHKGKKKDCVVQAALEACRILDHNGLLRQANHEPRKRKMESSSDDDDEFYDRTTEAEMKRKRKAGEDKAVSLSYEQLLEEEEKLQSRLTETEERIKRCKEVEQIAKQRVDVDLDVYMSGLSDEKVLDKTDIRKSRFEVQQIKADIAKVKRMIQIARPIDLIPIKKQSDSQTSEIKKKLELPLFGKRFGFTKLKPHIVTASKPKEQQTIDNKQAIESIEEFEDDDDDDEEMVEANRIKDKINIPLKDETHKDESSASCSDEKEQPSSVTESSKNQCEPQSKTNEQISSVVGNNMQSTEPIEKLAEQTKTKVEKINKPSKIDQTAVPVKMPMRNIKSKQLRKLVDIDDTEEDKKKFSQWLPPKDQSGDGVTHLNAKFGY